MVPVIKILGPSLMFFVLEMNYSNILSIFPVSNRVSVSSMTSHLRLDKYRFFFYICMNSLE